MNFKEYCRWAFFHNLPQRLEELRDFASEHKYYSRENKPLIIRKFQVWISHDVLRNLQIKHKKIVINNAVRLLHEQLEQEDVYMIFDSTFKIKNQIPGRRYVIGIDVLIENNKLAPGGIFYEIGESYAKLVR